MRIEAFLLGFDGDAYGADMVVDFLARLRDEADLRRRRRRSSARMHDDIARTAALNDPAYLELGL